MLGGDTQNRTGESEFCRLVPYRLAMSPFIEKALNVILSAFHVYGADDGARTRYLHLGKVALYQMSYIRKSMVPPDGIEPSTRGFSVPCSTN